MIMVRFMAWNFHSMIIYHFVIVMTPLGIVCNKIVFVLFSIYLESGSK